jgi:hypothetical protein
MRELFKTKERESCELKASNKFIEERLQQIEIDAKKSQEELE